MLSGIVTAQRTFTPVRRISAFGMWGDRPHPNATTVTLDIAGKHVTKQAPGNGPVNATFNAIIAACGVDGSLEQYDVKTKQGVGAAGFGRITIWLNHQGQTYKGIANDRNVEVGTVDACLAAINNMLRAKRKLYRDSVRRGVTRPVRPLIGETDACAGNPLA